MSLTTIKTALLAALDDITGVVDAVSATNIPPDNAACPLIVLTRQEQGPFLTVSVSPDQKADYIWHFIVKLLYEPLGLDQPETWDSAIEPFPARIITTLYGRTLRTALKAIVAEVSIDVYVGPVDWNGNVYFGCELPFDVIERINA